MPPIGETLREARMRQRLDIADVESRTKIRAKYLRALENEEWGLLPGPTFVRTFLRTYAEVVGIDPHLLVEEYRLNHEPREEYDFQPLAPSPPRRDRRDRRARRQAPGPPRGAALVVALAVGLLGFLLVLGLLGDDDSGKGGSATTPATDTTERATQPQPKQRERPAPKGVNVRVEPSEPTYVCADTGPGSEVTFQGTLDAPRVFRDPRRVRLNVGKRSVEVTLNREPVEFDDTADALGLVLTRAGSSELPIGARPCA